MSTIRQFNETDWYAYAGAEVFKNNAQPLIYEYMLNRGTVELAVIADKNGIQILMFGDEETEDEQMVVWQKAMPLVPLRAEGELRALAKVIEEYTYAPDLSYAIDHEHHEEFKGFNCIY